MPRSERHAPHHEADGGRAGRENLPGYIFLSPWLLGLLAITAVPMLLSLITVVLFGTGRFWVHDADAEGP